MPSLEDTWWPAAHGDRQVAGEGAWIREALSDEERIEAVRALALAVHEDACTQTRHVMRIPCGTGWSCSGRARIEALGK